MKKLFKCLTLLIAVLALQGCPMPEPSLKTQIIGTWKHQNEMWTFMSSGNLTIKGLADRPNGEWKGTWAIDEKQSIMYIKETIGYKYETTMDGEYYVKIIDSSTMELTLKGTYGNWIIMTFTKYSKPSDEGPAGAPQK